jgi:hypothetical protein
MHGGGRGRERRERADEADQWARLLAKEGGRGREWQVGPTAIQIKFKIIQIRSKLVRIKTRLPELENFKIKYVCEVFDKRNNFPASNFLRFRMDFELTISEVKV